jgi:hypothetical protein
MGLPDRFGVSGTHPHGTDAKESITMKKNLVLAMAAAGVLSLLAADWAYAKG